MSKQKRIIKIQGAEGGLISGLEVDELILEDCKNMTIEFCKLHEFSLPDCWTGTIPHDNLS